MWQAPYGASCTSARSALILLRKEGLARRGGAFFFPLSLTALLTAYAVSAAG